MESYRPTQQESLHSYLSLTESLHSTNLIPLVKLLGPFFFDLKKFIFDFIFAKF